MLAGAFPGAFAKNGEPASQLAELLSEDEIKAARASTINTHYTSYIASFHQLIKLFLLQIRIKCVWLSTC